MSEENNEEIGNSWHISPKIKSYSIDEILAAGGPTAFAEKLGKNPQALIEYLKNVPKDAFLTDEEAEQALKMLKERK